MVPSPTDNDFGNGIDKRCAVWRYPGTKRIVEKIDVQQSNPAETKIEFQFHLRDVESKYRTS